MSKGKAFFVIVLLTSVMMLTSMAFPGLSLSAEKFPSREITIIVQFTAGGPVDLATRTIAEYLRKELGVPVIVENRPEAGGVKGVIDVYKAKPDGYLLLANLFPRNAQTEIVYKTPYKILDFTYLGAFQKQDELVAVLNDSPYRSLKDLLEASKKKSLNCSIAGMGSLSHLDAMVLKKKVGVNLEVVPFKGSSPAMMALLGGNVDFTTLDDLTVLLQKDKTRYLVIFSEERSEKFPGVPTFKELGYDVPAGYSILGISGPPNMPDGVRNALETALAKAAKNPELIRKIDKLGPTPLYKTGADFRATAESFYKLVQEYKDIFVK